MCDCGHSCLLASLLYSRLQDHFLFFKKLSPSLSIFFFCFVHISKAIEKQESLWQYQKPSAVKFLVCSYQYSLSHTNGFVVFMLPVSSMNCWYAPNTIKQSHAWWSLCRRFMPGHIWLGSELRWEKHYHDVSPLFLVSSGTQSKWMCSLGALWMKFLFRLTCD